MSWGEAYPKTAAGVAVVFFLYNENPRLCRGFQKALAMGRKKEPPMI